MADNDRSIHPNRLKAEQVITSTFSSAWKDFYTHIPHQPHVSSVPDEIIAISRDNWRRRLGDVRGRLRRKCVDVVETGSADKQQKSRWKTGTNAASRVTYTVPVLDGSFPLAREIIEPSLPTFLIKPPADNSSARSANGSTRASTPTPTPGSILAENPKLKVHLSFGPLIRITYRSFTIYEEAPKMPITYGSNGNTNAFAGSSNSNAFASSSRLTMNSISTATFSSSFGSVGSFAPNLITYGSKGKNKTDGKGDSSALSGLDRKLWGRKVRPVPPYTFCGKIKGNIWVQEQPVLQFVPTFPDNIEIDLNQLALDYESRFAWDDPGRDPDIDIILIETLNRLEAYKARHPRLAPYLSYKRIDKTYILNQQCDTILGWNQDRDLFPFPGKVAIKQINGAEGSSTANTAANGISPAKARVTMLNDDGDEDEDKDGKLYLGQAAAMQEVFCPNSACRYNGCALHVDDGRSDCLPPLPVPEVSHFAQDLLARPKSSSFRGCSTNCYYIHPSSAQLFESLTERDLVALLVVLDNWLLKEMQYAEQKQGMYFASENKLDDLAESEVSTGSVNGHDGGRKKVCDLIALGGYAADGKGGRSMKWSCSQIGNEIKVLLSARQANKNSSNKLKIIPETPQTSGSKRRAEHQEVFIHELIDQAGGQGQVNEGMLGGEKAKINGNGHVKKKMKMGTGRANEEREASPEFAKSHRDMECIDLCLHDGPCNSVSCICYAQGAYCGRDCRCSGDCKRRYPGCDCHGFTVHTHNSEGQSPAVCQTNNCLCYRMGRECDPVLCGGCGATAAKELLTTEDKSTYIGKGKTWKPGKCRNIGLTTGEFQPVRCGVSTVAGYGLFAQKDIRKNALISEYLGEAVNNLESAKRYKVYALISRNYMFELNKYMDLDGHNRGNVARYINDPGVEGKSNCIPRVVHVQGNHRVEIRALRAIKAGEELFFHYGEQFGLTRAPNLEKKRNWKSAKNKPASGYKTDDERSITAITRGKGKIRVKGGRGRGGKK